MRDILSNKCNTNNFNFDVIIYLKSNLKMPAGNLRYQKHGQRPMNRNMNRSWDGSSRIGGFDGKWLALQCCLSTFDITWYSCSSSQYTWTFINQITPQSTHNDMYIESDIVSTILLEIAQASEDQKWSAGKLVKLWVWPVSTWHEFLSYDTCSVHATTIIVLNNYSRCLFSRSSPYSVTN